MINSMTGFGRAERRVGDKTFFVELKALNGKQFDLSLKLPALLKSFEFDIRQRLQESLVRGTVECVVIIKQNGTAKPVVINTDLIRSYYIQLTDLAAELNVDTQSILSSLLRLPEVVTPGTDQLHEDEFTEFLNVLQDAIDALNLHRRDEGNVLEADLKARIEAIRKQEVVIARLAPNREIRIREEISQLLEKHVGREQIDENRMEQEIIYYLEKIDIHEEQIRLKQHGDYFMELLQDKSLSKGKKLSFILQEIGREINTTGSKAYDAEIQKSVVEMKDELEKAKEQVLNVL
jgi:uncharacterized protein (TIGR00255 family)